MPAQFIRTLCIIGHRATGKTTTGRLLARQINWDFIDLDAHLESTEHKSAAELVAENPARFRALEREHLAQLLAAPHDKPRIIALGAGCDTLPPGPLYLWLERDGWQESARTERQRLHPHLDFSAELHTMISEREPRWQAAAHVRYVIPRTRTPERVVSHLTTLITLAANALSSPLAAKTWFVPTTPAEMTRAAHDATLLGLAGLEIRSDFFPDPPNPTTHPTPLLASLRTHDAAWLTHFPAETALDIDLQFLPTALSSPNFHNRRPAQLILSTHPSRVNRADIDALHTAATYLQTEHPALCTRLVLKYAPRTQTIAELRQAIEFTRHLHDLGYTTTFLPQNPRFFWLRPLLAHGFALPANATNYMPVGLAAPQARESWQHHDLQKWLPHFTATPIEIFDALLGDPIDKSLGELWHRKFATYPDDAHPQGTTGYIAIPTTAESLPETLPLLHQIGFRGLSITSPLKRAILDQPHVENPHQLPAANTLRRTPTGWQATDTDFDGMTATLDALEQAGIPPGPTAIIGRGGVSPAIQRALTERGWSLTDHISARAGWPQNHPVPEYHLIINAAGPGLSSAHHNAPPTRAWIDLHYTDVASAPSGTLHLAGDLFFHAQARAQRRFWYRSNAP